MARHLRREIDERITYPGLVLKEPNSEEIRNKASELHRENIQALAVCLLWSTANPEHEKLVKQTVEKQYPDLHVCISSEVAPVLREYERMVTTAVNASLMPVLSNYLADVEQELQKAGFRGRLLLMQSHGGVAEPSVLREKPIFTLRGGPVAGVVASAYLSRILKRNRILSCDIGGTSTDTALILDHKVPVADETEVDYYPIKIPTADVRCIGAGGGSIAYVDVGGALRVGPESAGSLPGPACYGGGGKRPTVTDANLILGRISAGQFCGGRVKLCLDAARASMQEIGEEFGWNAEQTAYAILRVAVANIAESIRLQTIDCGHDPRDFSLLAFGGGGPLSATLVAEACSISEVIIPIEPGVFSTLGMVAAEHGYYGQLGYLKPLREVDPPDLTRKLGVLETEGARMLCSVPSQDHHARSDRSAAMRYTLQEWEIRVPIPEGDLDASDLVTIEQNFHTAHRARYGFACEDKAVEFVSLYVDTLAAAPPFQYEGPKQGDAEPSEALKESREVFVDDHTGTTKVPVYERRFLKSGNVLRGPFLVEEPTSTTFVQRGWSGTVDTMGNIILRPEDRI